MKGCFETKQFPFLLVQAYVDKDFPYHEGDIPFTENLKFYDVPEVKQFFLPLSTPFKKLQPYQPYKLWLPLKYKEFTFFFFFFFLEYNTNIRPYSFVF